MKRILLLFFLFLVCIYPFLVQTESVAIDTQNIFQSPNWQHWGGTDSLGRDLFHRSLSGAGTSLLVCLLAMVLTYSIGLAIGSLLSFWTRANHLIIFVIDVFDSVPNFLLVALFSILINKGLSLGGSLVTSFSVLAWSIALAAWPSIARNVRLEILQLRSKEYLTASVIIGASSFYLVRAHYLRALGPWLRISVIHNVPQFLLIESVLSFTGFGLGPQQATLGYLIYEGWKNAMLYPQLFLVPSGILCALVLILTSGMEENSENSVRTWF